MSRSGGGRGKDANLAALNHRRGGRLSPSDATFVPTVAAELLFQSVVGTWQVGIIIAVEKPRPITTRNLDEMGKCLFQLTGLPSMAGHGPEKTGKTFSDFTAGAFRWIVQNLRRFVHPGKADLHTRPQRGRFL